MRGQSFRRRFYGFDETLAGARGLEILSTRKKTLSRFERFTRNFFHARIKSRCAEDKKFAVVTENRGRISKTNELVITMTAREFI